MENSKQWTHGASERKRMGGPLTRRRSLEKKTSRKKLIICPRGGSHNLLYQEWEKNNAVWGGVGVPRGGKNLIINKKENSPLFQTRVSQLWGNTLGGSEVKVCPSHE